MMKITRNNGGLKIVFLALLTMITGIGARAQEYTVIVDLKNLEGSKVIMAYEKKAGYVMDTPVVLGNQLVFKGKTDQPVLASLVVRNPKLNIKANKGYIPSPSLQFFLTNEEIWISGDALKVYLADVKGGKENTEWNRIKPRTSKFKDENWEAAKTAYRLQASGDSSGFTIYDALKEANNLKSDELENRFIRQYPKSLVSVMLLSSKINNLGAQELETAYHALDKSVKGTSWGMLISTKINGLKATAVGQKAIDFIKKDRTGNEVRLSGLKGKYVLLDFWGSWCGPCRNSHPHLKQLYQKYKPKGLEIIGVAHEQGSSLNENRKSWLEAIKVDGIDWIQILNNEDKEKQDLVKFYGVTAFPTKILLDQEGKILARYTGDGKELDQTLENLMK